ncbi:MAG TPA: hypothetical protein VKY89_16595 [Thermoanaerobaculia bacterium]|nr:hypothetical protein [Thermoanaerobaculia bacterium]
MERRGLARIAQASIELLPEDFNQAVRSLMEECFQRRVALIAVFYTAGAVISEALEQNGIRDYVPYAVKEGLYALAPGWAHYQTICARDWQPHVDGKIDFDEALARIARDF